MKHPETNSEHEAVEHLCSAHESASDGLPDGCMPHSMCAIAHQNTPAFAYTAVLFLALGAMVRSLFIPKKKEP